MFQNDTLCECFVHQEVPSGQPSVDPVGRPVIHHSAMKQVTGEATYVDDIPPRKGLSTYPIHGAKSMAEVKMESLWYVHYPQGVEKWQQDEIRCNGMDRM